MKWGVWTCFIMFITFFTLLRWLIFYIRWDEKITDFLWFLPKSNVKYRKQYVYPSVLLALKAIFFIVLSLYALHPFFSVVLEPKNDGRCS